MGSPSEEKDRDDLDEDQVAVVLSKPFYLGKTEVTQQQWRAVMGTTPWQGKESVQEGDNYPAAYVSWEDAKAFCKKLSEQENVAYRLTTEAEWEFACRAGSTARFSFGDNESKLSDYAWCRGFDEKGNTKEEKYPHEVGKKKANPFALHDMHGNLSEYCEDEYLEKLPGGTDPLVSSGDFLRVTRGGDWLNYAAECRSASRRGHLASYRNHFLGFRVVRSAAP